MSILSFNESHFDTISKLIPFMMVDIFTFWDKDPGVLVSMEDGNCIVRVSAYYSSEQREATQLVRAYILGHLRK